MLVECKHRNIGEFPPQVFHVLRQNVNHRSFATTGLGLNNKIPVVLKKELHDGLLGRTENEGENFAEKIEHFFSLWDNPIRH
jgi:hypothetical protein